MSEEEFLKSTLKKIFTLARIHSDLHNPKDKKEDEKKEEVYIDQIQF